MALPNSNWIRFRSAWRKEVATEFRSPQGWFGSVLFGLLTVIAISLSGYYRRPDGEMAALLLILAILFAVALAVPRLFLGEDEAATFDTLRVISDPTAAFLGKTVFALIQIVAQTLLVTGLFFLFTKAEPSNLLAAASGAVAFALATASGVAFCSSLVLGAANRWTLALVVSLPVCLPLVFLGVSAVGAGFGVGSGTTGWAMTAALLLASAAWLSLGALVSGRLWRLG
jgi:heme exporter protein B